MDTITTALTAEDIFGADDCTIRAVRIPEWKKNGQPGILHFKTMSADASIKFQELFKDPNSRRTTFIRMFAECACDPHGKLLFTTADVERLRSKNVAVFFRLQDFLLQINGMATPTRSWDAVKGVLEECGIPAEVIAVVKNKWDEGDNNAVEVVKND